MAVSQGTCQALPRQTEPLQTPASCTAARPCHLRRNGRWLPGSRRGDACVALARASPSNAEPLPPRPAPNAWRTRTLSTYASAGAFPARSDIASAAAGAGARAGAGGGEARGCATRQSSALRRQKRPPGDTRRRWGPRRAGRVPGGRLGEAASGRGEQRHPLLRQQALDGPARQRSARSPAPPAAPPAALQRGAYHGVLRCPCACEAAVGE